MPGDRATWRAVDAARARMAAAATVQQIREAPDGPRLAGVPPWQGGRLLKPVPEWSWRTTGDPGTFEIWHAGESVAMFTCMPGHIEHRAVFLDAMVDHLNNPPA